MAKFRPKEQNRLSSFLILKVGELTRLHIKLKGDNEFFFGKIVLELAANFSKQEIYKNK